MSDGDYLKLRSKIVLAGKKAVEELIKIAEDKIKINEGDTSLAADRIKNAAASKKLAIFDALEILQKLEEESEFIKKSNSGDGDQENLNFAEKRAK